MENTVLLVSRDPILQETRALILERAGYKTIQTASLASGLQLSRECQICVIGHSFAPREQSEFSDAVRQTNSDIFIVCLRFGLINPEQLLKTVATCFATRPGQSRICVIEPNGLIEQPEGAC